MQQLFFPFSFQALNLICYSSTKGWALQSQEEEKETRYLQNVFGNCNKISKLNILRITIPLCYYYIFANGLLNSIFKSTIQIFQMSHLTLTLCIFQKLRAFMIDRNPLSQLRNRCLLHKSPKNHSETQKCPKAAVIIGSPGDFSG